MIVQKLFAQSIMTKYLGPTDYKGGRVKATATGGRTVTLSWDYGLGIEGNHVAAAKALATKLDWTERGWIGGGLNEGGFVFVSVPSDNAQAFRS